MEDDKAVEEGNGQREGAEGTDLGKGEGIILKIILLGSMCVCVCVCAQTVQKNVGWKIMDRKCVMEGQILSLAVLPRSKQVCVARSKQNRVSKSFIYQLMHNRVALKEYYNLH
jgi:hypothetical protein